MSITGQNRGTLVLSKTTLPVVILHTTAQPIVQAFEQMPHPSLSSSELHNEEVLKGEPDDIYYWS